MVTTIPEAPKSRPAVKRKLDFLTDEPRLSIEVSPVKGPAKGPLYATRNTTQPRVDNSDLQTSPSIGSKRRLQAEMDVDDARQDDDDDPFHDHAPIYDNGDDEMIDPDFQAPAEEDLPISSPIKEPPKKKGRKSGDGDITISPALLTRKQPSAKLHTDHAPVSEFTESEEPTITDANRPAKKRTSTGPKPKANIQPTSRPRDSAEDEIPPITNQQPKKRGRPPKSSKPLTHHSPKPSSPPINTKPLNLMPPPKRISVPRSQSPSKRPARSLTILREATPAEDPSIRRTRSGRQVLRPLEYWLGERTERRHDGSIVGVVRAENVEVPGRSYRRSNGVARRRAQGKGPSASGVEGVEEEAEVEMEVEAEVEEWEAEGGVIRGFVRAWDAALGAAVEDDIREQDLAFSSNSIETRDVVGSDFRYAKFLSLPFFGCGMVDVPAGGFKRAKNAHKMQMVFFVHVGKVLVRVGDAEFTISKGGVWHVPRGESKLSFVSLLFLSFRVVELGVWQRQEYSGDCRPARESSTTTLCDSWHYIHPRSTAATCSKKSL